MEEGVLNNLLDKIHHHHGYDFRDYARSSVERRINFFMHQRGIKTVEELQSRILTDDQWFEFFVQELSVTVTEMFRNPSFFKKIRDSIIPRLATYPFVKIWIAGCATGQEVYSLAIILREEGLDHKAIIYATDINQRSLSRAKEGLYDIENMQLYTTNYREAGGKESFSNYYTSKFGSVLFDRSLRDNIVFAAHNLATDGSFHEFQLIICRNVLMYFNQSLQNKVISLFYDSLCPLGILGLGDKESLHFFQGRHLFADLDRKEKIYMKVK